MKIKIAITIDDLLKKPESWELSLINEPGWKFLMLINSNTEQVIDNSVFTFDGSEYLALKTEIQNSIEPCKVVNSRRL